jgi:hypothetical protein
MQPRPWKIDKRGKLIDADGDTVLVEGVGLPMGRMSEHDDASQHRDLLFAAPQLKAENKRLRAALERIGSTEAFASPMDYSMKTELLARIDYARKALEEEQ